MATTHLATRAKHGDVSDDDGVTEGDPSTTTGLLLERLQAWKHMCGYLENYVSAVAKDQAARSKDQEKILKTVSSPLREGDHFDPALGGIAGLFENLRANTQAQSTLLAETSKNLTGQVLPILQRLHTEIKSKNKEISAGAGKSAKAVEHARAASQKYIDSLGQHVGVFDAVGGKVTAHNDPYVLQRGIYHRLNKQLLEENNNRQDLLSVQNSFQQFEAHVITTVQAAVNSYNQFMSGQADRQKAMYGDIASTASNIPLDFEWNGFVNRSGHILVNPGAPTRTIDHVSFPNQNHRSTRPLIEGSLERKSRGMGALKGYSSGYYTVTPAHYLHEFKDNDNFHKDPTPEISLYLPDCTIGAVDGPRFTIKGKDTSGGKLGQKMAMTSEFAFKAHSAADAQQWHSIISTLTSATTNTVPTSPVESRNITPINTRLDESQQQGVVRSPNSASTGVITSPGTAGTHYHRGPLETKLEERKYVQK